MSISNIQGQTGAQTAYGLTQTPAPAQTTPAYDAAGHGSNSAASTPDPNPQQASDQIRISSPVTLKNLDTVKAIEQLHNKMNTLIKGVRQTNEVINNASEQITHMSTALENIVKNFPPFPVDSKDRQELLMTYASIRQEILKMSFPPLLRQFTKRSNQPGTACLPKTLRCWLRLYRRLRTAARTHRYMRPRNSSKQQATPCLR